MFITSNTTFLPIPLLNACMKVPRGDSESKIMGVGWLNLDYFFVSQNLTVPDTQKRTDESMSE